MWLTDCTGRGVTSLQFCATIHDPQNYLILMAIIFKELGKIYALRSVIVHSSECKLTVRGKIRMES